MDVTHTVWAWRTPPDPAKIAAARARANRRHGVVQALVGAAIGTLIFSFPWWWPGAAAWLPRGIAYVAWSVSAVVLATALLSPKRIYAAIQRGVNAAARVLGVVLTFILMTPIFVLFFVPFRALFRSGRRDRLQRAFPAPAAQTFWIERAADVKPDTYRRQF